MYTLSLYGCLPGRCYDSLIKGYWTEVQPRNRSTTKLSLHAMVYVHDSFSSVNGFLSIPCKIIIIMIAMHAVAIVSVSPQCMHDH